MKFQAVVQHVCKLAVVLLVSLPALLGTGIALAQDSTFVACARYSDRGQRIACLEDALETALSAQQGSQVTGPAAPVAESTQAARPVAPNPVAANPPPSTPPEAPVASAEEQGERSSLLYRIRSFGRDDEEVSLSTDASGNERLHDTITALEQRTEMWIVTLSSGQVWRQAYPRTLNLRVGDDISIYQEGIGNGYRMATPRLSGFIRVERLK
jgi:hypothetical protein